jgi:hypothetical protein
MTAGMLVMVTTPLALVIARTEPLVTIPLGMTKRPVALGVDDVAEDTGVVVEDDVTPVLASGGLAARVGLGVAADEIVGVSAAVFATVVVVPVVDAVDAPAANWPGVAKRAAVVGVTVALLVAPAVGADTVAGAATNVAAPLPPAPLEMTGVASELIDALTVASGFAYIEGGITCPVTGIWPGGVGWGPVGLM